MCDYRYRTCGAAYPFDPYGKDRHPADRRRAPARAGCHRSGGAAHLGSAAATRLRHRRQLLPTGSPARGRRRTRGRGRQTACALPTPRRPAHVPRGRHQPLRPGGHRFGARAAGRRLAPLRNQRRRGHDSSAAGRHRRRRQSPAGAVRAQDRPRSGVDRRRDDRRHRGQQRQRHVLRHGRQQLPDARRDARRARRRCRARHRGSGKRRGLPLLACGAAGDPRRARARDEGQCRAGGTHPAQVPDQEHDRLQPQCARRLRRPGRHPDSPDDRLGGDAGLHLRDHLPHRARAPVQGERVHRIQRSRSSLHGGDAALQRPGVRRRADGSSRARLGRAEAGDAREHP